MTLRIQLPDFKTHCGFASLDGNSARPPDGASYTSRRTPPPVRPSARPSIGFGRFHRFRRSLGHIILSLVSSMTFRLRSSPPPSLRRARTRLRQVVGREPSPPGHPQTEPEASSGRRQARQDAARPAGNDGRGTRLSETGGSHPLLKPVGRPLSRLFNGFDVGYIAISCISHEFPILARGQVRERITDALRGAGPRHPSLEEQRRAAATRL
jgi:hypothetical protein